QSNVALFSMDEDNPRIKAMQKLGGISAVYENGYITICRGEWKLRVIKAVNVPLTYGGRATFMIQNVLPAVITAYIKGFTIDEMKVALETFIPSAAQTPGRLNLFQFKDFQVLLDYAHNPAGMRALQKFIENIDATVKVGIIAGVGDRREEDTNEMGSVAADMFDEIIIRQDKHLRGRTDTEIIAMLDAGIKMRRSEEHTSELQSRENLVCRLLLEKKKYS